MSALVWRVAQERSVLQYDKVLDFISLVIEIVPEILNPIQKAQLIMGLRARVRSYSEVTYVDVMLKLISLHFDDNNIEDKVHL